MTGLTRVLTGCRASIAQRIAPKIRLINRPAFKSRATPRRTTHVKLVIAYFIAAAFCSSAFAQNYFSPGIISRVPKGKEITRSNKIRSAAVCQKQHGKWLSGKGYAYCVVPYKDAGKLCQNSKQCIGHCIMPLDEKTVDGQPLPEGHGICQLDDSADDCGRYHFENGEVVIFNCD